MKILVTGAGGMVGSHMVEKLYDMGHEVLGTYYKPTIDLKEINPKINLKECDVRYSSNVTDIITEFRPDQIYHLAAQSYPTVSWDRPYETMDTNILGTVAVFESIKKIRKIDSNYDPVVVVACSSAEYGATLNQLDSPFVKETDQLQPLHPYGVSKVGQDLLAFQYFANDGIKSIRARIFNTTGPRKVQDVTSDFTKRAIQEEKRHDNDWRLVVGNIETKRAIMDVQDLIEALILLANHGTYGDVYNISSERVYKIKDIITLIEKDMGVKFTLEVDKKLIRPTDEQIIVGDITKLKRDTGWSQKYDLENTISRMLEYWRNHL